MCVCVCVCVCVLFKVAIALREANTIFCRKSPKKSAYYSVDNFSRVPLLGLSFCKTSLALPLLS